MGTESSLSSEHTQPEQQSLALGYVAGEPFNERPQDLYIPPDALEVILEAFEGPLDLLLYLIRRSKLDILDLPVQEITAQYMEYIALMKELQLELAAEYLLMAAWLAEIKSRLLLPKHTESGDDDGDPRAELLRRLQEYELFKRKAEEIDSLPRNERDFYTAQAEADDAVQPIKILPDIFMQDLLMALSDVVKRAENFSHHHIQPEAISTRERMSQVLERLSADGFHPFSELFDISEGKAGVVVTFLAVLELVKEQLIEMVQNELFSVIHVRKVQHG